MSVFFFWPPFYTLTALFPESVSFIEVPHSLEDTCRDFSVFCLVCCCNTGMILTLHRFTMWQSKVRSEECLNWSCGGKFPELPPKQEFIWVLKLSFVLLLESVKLTKWAGCLLFVSPEKSMLEQFGILYIACSFRADLEGRTTRAFLILGGVLCTRWSYPRLPPTAYKIEIQEAEQHLNYGNSLKLLKGANSR